MGVDDVLEELILGIAAVDDVESVRLQGGAQLLLFVAVAVGDGGMTGHALEDVEVQVEFGGAMLLVEPQSPGHLRQGGQQAAIDGSQAAQKIRRLCRLQRQGLLREFADDALQRLGIEDAGSLAERPRETRGQSSFLHLVQATGPLQGPQTVR